MPTIVDVARRAGVSVTTASRALNDHVDVHQDTRRRVLSAAEELGYVPNDSARGLRNAKTRAIGMVVTDLLLPAFRETIDVLERETTSRGYSLLLCGSRDSTALEDANVRRLYERRVEALILFSIAGPPPSIRPFRELDLPCAVVSNVAETGDVNLSTGISGAVVAALAHLAGFGHTRAAVIIPGYGSHRAIATNIGSWFAQAGLKFDPALAGVCQSVGECASLTRELLKQSNRPTALLCLSPNFLGPMLAGVRSLGLSLPRDLSLVSLGDSLLAEYFWPPITVVAAQYAAIGRALADYVFARIAGGSGEPQMAELRAATTYNLILRESTAPPPPLP